MNKRPAIFQEIEDKLAKDDFASKLPAYHPAKGRRKKVTKKDKAAYIAIDGIHQYSESSHHAPSFNGFQASSDEPAPRVAPEIERPDKQEIFPPTPGEREIDPQRDLPHRELPNPEEEEIPGRDPGREIEDPGKMDTIF